MTLNTQQYRNNPVNLEGVVLTKENAEEVARWCGGQLEGSKLIIPSVTGPLVADFGRFIYKDGNTGRFSYMTKEYLEKEYQRIGLRQDGIGNTWNGQR